MSYYRVITRWYYDSPSQLTPKKGNFIARGQWADGHLAYSLLDENNDPIDEEDCMYVQLRGRTGLFMQRI